MCFLRPALTEKLHQETSLETGQTKAMLEKQHTSSRLPISANASHQHHPETCCLCSSAIRLGLSRFSWLAMGLCSAGVKKIQLPQLGCDIFSTGWKRLKNLICASLLPLSVESLTPKRVRDSTNTVERESCSHQENIMQPLMKAVRATFLL